MMLPESFNWLDIVIAVLLILSLVQGIRAGFIRSVFNVAGVVAGLILAVNFYLYGSVLLLEHVNLPQFLASVVSFITIFSLVSFVFFLAGSSFRIVTRLSIFKFADRVGGSIAGLMIGLIIVGAVLLLLAVSPVYAMLQNYYEDSYLAPPIIDKTHDLYDQLTVILPLNLPPIIPYPERFTVYYDSEIGSSAHSRVDFKELDGVTCFACGEPVELIGFFNNNRASVSPKFVCTGCGRTSDGCQTYEGYHAMYEKCPVILGSRGHRFDCGVWTNYRYVQPAGVCTVCGAK